MRKKNPLWRGELADVIPKRISHPKIEDQNQSEKDDKIYLKGLKRQKKE